MRLNFPPALLTVLPPTSTLNFLSRLSRRAAAVHLVFVQSLPHVALWSPRSLHKALHWLFNYTTWKMPFKYASAGRPFFAGHITRGIPIGQSFTGSKNVNYWVREILLSTIKSSVPGLPGAASRASQQCCLIRRRFYQWILVILTYFKVPYTSSTLNIVEKVN